MLANTLKHPRSDDTRALNPGVTHKFVSASCLDTALRSRLEQVRDKNQKLHNLQITYEKLQKAWCQSQTARPFTETLVKLFEEQKLTDFDINFLQTWLKKKDKGRGMLELINKLETW